MTRLKPEDIENIEVQICEYDSLFQKQTGHTMEEICCKAYQLPSDMVKMGAAVVPVTSGLGIISGFSDMVAAILRHLEIPVIVTKRPDVAGLQEAYLEQADVIFMADDDIYSAFGEKRTVVSDNGIATGRAFACALVEAMRKKGVSPSNQEVLVLGMGIVGKSAAEYFLEQEMKPVLYDLDLDRCKQFQSQHLGCAIAETGFDKKKYHYFFDATTAADLLTEEDVSSDTIVSAPGMPCGITEEARKIATVIHNPLELGTISMYFECLKKWEKVQRKGN